MLRLRCVSDDTTCGSPFDPSTGAPLAMTTSRTTRLKRSAVLPGTAATWSALPQIPGLARLDRERVLERRATAQIQRGRGRLWIAADAHDPGDAAAIQKVLLDGVARFAGRVDAAEDALKVGQARDAHGLVHRSAREAVHKRRIGRADRRDRPNTARNFLDVYAGIGQRGWHRRSPQFSSDRHNATWRSALRVQLCAWQYAVADSTRSSRSRVSSSKWRTPCARSAGW